MLTKSQKLKANSQQLIANSKNIIMDWNKIRQDFPVADNVTYFQSAGMSPMPGPVLETITGEYKKLNQYGDIYWMKDKIKADEFRKTLADIINASPGDLAFLANNSLVMSLVALSLKNNIKEDFNLISMEEEFPSNSVPFEYLKIQMKYVQPENHRYPVSKILSQIDENTAAVVTSYVQFATGFRQDIETLGMELKKRNILFIVNATQGFPFYPVDVKSMNIDVLTCSIHKWGFAGHVGTIFYTSQNYRDRFPSPVAGWLSVKPDGVNFIHYKKNIPFDIYENADQYFFGTYNLQTMLALKAAFEYLQQIGFGNIRSRITGLGDYLVSKLENLPLKIISPVEKIEEMSPIISFQINDFSSDECVAFMEQHGVYTSVRNGFVRVAVNFFNNEKDIDKLCEVLKSYFNSKK